MYTPKEVKQLCEKLLSIQDAARGVDPVTMLQMTAALARSMTMAMPKDRRSTEHSSTAAKILLLLDCFGDPEWVERNKDRAELVALKLAISTAGNSCAALFLSNRREDAAS